MQALSIHATMITLRDYGVTDTLKAPGASCGNARPPAPCRFNAVTLISAAAPARIGLKVSATNSKSPDDGCADVLAPMKMEPSALTRELNPPPIPALKIFPGRTETCSNILGS